MSTSCDPETNFSKDGVICPKGLLHILFLEREAHEKHTETTLQTCGVNYIYIDKGYMVAAMKIHNWNFLVCSLLDWCPSYWLWHFSCAIPVLYKANYFWMLQYFIIPLDATIPWSWMLSHTFFTIKLIIWLDTIFCALYPCRIDIIKPHIVQLVMDLWQERHSIHKIFIYFSVYFTLGTSSKECVLQPYFCQHEHPIHMPLCQSIIHRGDDSLVFIRQVILLTSFFNADYFLGDYLWPLMYDTNIFTLCA